MSKSNLNLIVQRNITTLTFDCYGTLVDWERGVATAVREILGRRNVSVSEDNLIRAFLKADADFIAKKLMPYSEVLSSAIRHACASFGIDLDRSETENFVGTLPSWPIFPETNSALERLSQRYRLAIISNIDNALIAETLKHFTVPIDVVMTSERADSYKPDQEIFRMALESLGEAPEQVLHIAEGLCEAEPARSLGMGSVWVRRSDRSDDGSGAVPDARVGSLTEIVEAFELKNSMSR